MHWKTSLFLVKIQHRVTNIALERVTTFLPLKIFAQLFIFSTQGHFLSLFANTEDSEVTLSRKSPPLTKMLLKSHSKKRSSVDSFIEIKCHIFLKLKVSVLQLKYWSILDTMTSLLRVMLCGS